MTSTPCYRHPNVVATGTCRGCFEPLCETCTIHDDGFVPRCAKCMRSRRRARWIVGSVAMVASAAAAVVGAMAWRQDETIAEADEVEAAKEATFDYGEHTGEVERLSERLAAEPCDRSAVLELSKAMYLAGDARGVLKRSQAFFAKCGELEELSRVQLESHRQLSEFTEAVAVSDELIEKDPYNATYHGWRGLDHERLKRYDRAAEDYLQALMLSPRLADVPINLANVYEKLGKPCEAMLPLQQVAFHYPEARNIGQIHARVAKLSAQGNCADMSGEGRARIRINPGEGVIRAPTKIYAQEGTFIVDTGASYVTLSREHAARLNIDPQGKAQIFVATANGVSSGYVVSLPLVEVQGVRAANVPAIVLDGLPPGADGLLGLSFLSRFDLKQTGTTFEIAARR